MPITPQDAKSGAEFTRDLNFFERGNSKEYSLYFEDFPLQKNLKVGVKSAALVRILRCNGHLMVKLKNILKTMIFLLTANIVYANNALHIYIYSTENNKELGTITAVDTEHGLMLTPNLTGLTPGLHGFHVHQNPSCADQGMAAGDHLDPEKTDRHLGPYTNQGHLGDLIALTVDNTGHAILPILAPRLKLADIQGHSLVIHAGGDNYSDNPKLGGGGSRIACGVVVGQ